MNKQISLKRALAAALLLSMLTECMPVNVFAENADDAQLRQALSESVRTDEYPSGMIDFLTPRMETSEDVKISEFAVVRRGNTDDAASVTFKAVDMTAKYGKDYKIKVKEGLFDKSLEANPYARLMSEEMYDEDTVVSMVSSETEVLSENSEELLTDDRDTYDVEAASENNEPIKTGGDDLRSARSAFTGEESDYSTWEENDRQTAEMLSEAYGDMYNELAGAEYTLVFEPGEYMKTLEFITMDDNISEDEEQVLFVLTNPENCALSDNPTGFMNITDNDEPEEITYDFTKSRVKIASDEDRAVLEIKRKTGVERYGTVMVSTASGTAEADMDYTPFCNEITFVPGQQYQKIEVPVRRHPASEESLFYVRLNDNEAEAEIVIKPINEPKTVLADENTETASESFGTAVLASVGWEDGQPAPWSRFESMVTGGTLVGYDGRERSSGSYEIVRDLTMKGKVTFDTWDNCPGWYVSTRKGGHWYRDAHPNSQIETFSIGGKQMWSMNERYEERTVSFGIPKEKRSSNQRLRWDVFGSTEKKEGNDAKTCLMGLRNVRLYSQPILVQLGAEDSDAYIQKKIYTSQDVTVNDGNALKAGTLKFSGFDNSVINKFFYDDDTVSFDPVWDLNLSDSEKDALYLWGFKIQTKAGGMPDFYYIKGDSFKISDLYLGKLKDSLTGATIGTQAQQSMSVNGESFVCYRIFPVYKQKAAYTTVQDDKAESEGLSFAANTFNFNQTIKTGRLDTIQIRIAATGDNNVKGFDYRYENYNQASGTSAETERSLDSEKLETASARALPYYKKNWNQYGGFLNSDAAVPQNLDFTPLGTDNVLYVSGELSDIDMTVHPAANSASDQAKGAAAYVTDDGTVKTAQFDRVDAGLLKGSSIDISPYKVGKPYQFFAAINEEDKYLDKNHILTLQWTDMTGDINKDGVLSKEEEFALGENAQFIQRSSFSGETFPYVPQLMGRIQLYYQIVPKAVNDTGHENSISGTVKLKTADVISHTNGKFKEIPLEGAHIIAGGKETFTDKDGHWTITSSEFDVNETYPVTAEYGGKNYNGYAMVNKDTQASNIVIDEYNTFDVVDFKAARVENKSEYENTEDWKITSIDSCAVSNEDKRQLYSFKINELNKGTATVGRVEVYRYDSAGGLKDTYTAVYNDSTGQYEVKKPSLIGTDNYNYSINPAAERAGAGDYLAIRVYDQNHIGYIEHNVGMIFKPHLSMLTVVNSFKSPFNGIIEFMNKMDTSLDLGFTQKLDDLAESKGDVTVTEDERTISFGWNKEFKKSYDSSKKKEDKDDKGEQKEAPDTPVEEIKESAKKLEGVSGGNESSKEEEKLKDEAKNTASNAVDKKSNDNKKHGKTNTDLKFTLSVGVSIVMGYDRGANKYYFKDLVVTGVIDGEASATYKYTTPVGITIMVKGELSGDITAMMVTEPFYKNPDKPDYLYMSDTDNKIDLNKLGSSDVDRKLSIYGKLMLRPKVTLSAGASFVKLASLTLSGSADFDMVFTTANAGKGSVTLSSELVLGLIGDKIKKKWLITKKKYDMFNINGTSMASLMSDGDYRYDVITEEDVDEQLYLNNRSYHFGETNNAELSEVSVNHYNEKILETGAYPSAQPLIKVISYGTASDGSDTSMIMLFLDCDENGTVLKYSICENNVWSQPQPADNDGADDDTVQIYDLGDRFIITWSSEAPGIDRTDFAARFNSRNIRAVFFDKTSKTFGDIMEVTRTTDGDACGDDSAAVAEYTAPDGTRKLLMTYVKSLYEQVNSDELMVGDVLNPYSTIAYRFYDFETNTWTEEYSENDINNLSLAMSSDEVELYAENWYGQGFVDLSKYVDIDDSSIIISENDEELGQMAGRWSRQPESSEISIKSMSSDPRAVEHKTISCGKYAVSAYVIDLDKEAATTEDREIFLQMYDFAKDKFYPLIRLTNDGVSQNNIILDETPEGVMLYYISDGNIVSFNITDMIARALYSTTANDGTEVLINSNCYTGYTSPYTIVEAEEDNPFTEFTVNAAEDAVLVTWSQNGISYREGIDPTSSEAVEAENYYRERQMYTVMETFEDFEEPYYDEDGSIATYPYTDDDGNLIDYNLEPDVNGQFGVVSAGDEMIRHGKIVTWTKPVQITEEQGESFTNIDCVIVAPRLLRMVYLKGTSTVKDISGTMMPVEDTDNRSLVVSDFAFCYAMLDGVIVNSDDVYAGQENLYIDVDVTNEAIWEMSDIKVKLYQQPKDGEKTLIGTETIDKLIGGNSERASIAWNVPQSLDGLKLTAEVEQNGFVFSEDEWEYEDDIQIVIDDISHEMLDRNTARLQVSVSNKGSENAENENVYVNLNGAETSSESFALLSGEKKVITMDVEVPTDAFEDTSDEEKISETAVLRVYTQFDVHDYEITRSADKALAELMKEAKIQNAETGETYTDKISVKEKDIAALNAVSDDNSTLDMKIRNYDSENIKVVNNMISPQKDGDTSVSIDIYPYINTYVTNNMDNMELIDTYLELPSSLIKTVNMTVSASVRNTSGGSGGGPAPAKPTPTPVPAATMSPSETEAPSENTALPFTDVKTEDWFYDNVKYVYENKLFSGISDTLFAPNEPMTRAMLVTVLYRAEGEPDMSEEIWGYPFEDVDADSFYGAAVYWARNNDIVRGYSPEQFAPDAPVTREQIAAILYRYAEFKGISTGEIGDLSQFADAESISKWAQKNVSWAIGKSLLTGRDNGMLDPTGNAARAEVAAMLQRFNESSLVPHEFEVAKTADLNKVVLADEEKTAEIAAMLYDYFGTEDAQTGNPYSFEIVGEFDADNEHYYLGRWQWNVEGHTSLLCDFVLKKSLTEMYDCRIWDNKIDWLEADSVIK